MLLPIPAPPVQYLNPLWRLILAVAMGAFVGRVASEWIGPGPAGAMVITLAAVTVAWFLSRKIADRLWSPLLLLLLLYVFHSEADPRRALFVLSLTLLSILLAIPATFWQARFKQRLFVSGRTLHSVFLFLLFSFFFFLYLHTLSPGVLPADSGELQLVAAELGVAHPPGFPLYTMLGHLMTRLPLDASAAYKLNLFSAVSSTATLILVYFTVYHLARRPLAAVVAALILGTSTTFWAQATTANIRSLTAFFAALAIYALVRMSRAAGQPDVSQPRWLTLLALALGFGITHHPSLAFMGIVFIVVVLLSHRDLLRRPRLWIWPLFVGAAGVLPLLYLPWRAAVGAWGAPADLTTLRGFLTHVLALGFRGDLFYYTQSDVLWERLKVTGNVMTMQFSPILLVGMGLGLVLLVRRAPQLALLLGGSFAIHTLITATYRAPQTVEYMLPAYIPAVVCLGYISGWLLDHSQTQRRPGVAITAALLAAVLLLSAIRQGWQNYPSFSYLSKGPSANGYTNFVFDRAPLHSAVLADWHWATPLWYRQEEDGVRPDLNIHFVFPTGEPYGATWARRIGEELATGRPVIATHHDSNTYTNLPPPEPLGEAFLFRREPRTIPPDDFSELKVVLGGQLELLGYHLEPPAVAIGEETTLTLAWRPLAPLPSSLHLFAHLVGDHGRLYALYDLPILPDGDGNTTAITLTQFRITPWPGIPPGKLTVMIGAYATEPFLDPEGQPRTAITTVEVGPTPWRPVTFNPVYRPVVNAQPWQRLVGYDWDTTLPDRPRLYLHWQNEEGYFTEVRDGDPAAIADLPPTLGPWGLNEAQRGYSFVAWLTGRQSPLTERPRGSYVPLGYGIVWSGNTISNLQSPISAGQEFTLRQIFTAGRPISRDLVVSVRLIGFEAGNNLWDWWDLDDSVPGLGAIPTLKWIAGTQVLDPHRLTVSETALPGQRLGGLVQLYDAFTGRPVPILDERISQEYPGIPINLGEIGD